MQNKELWRPLARATDDVFEANLTYREASTSRYSGHHAAGPYDTKPVLPGFRPKTFKVVSEPDVVLTGFRTFLTRDRYFFNDCTIIPEFDTRKLLNKLSGSQLEGLSAECVDEGIIMPAPKDVIELDGPVICACSDEPANYGSWIYRVIPKLLAYHSLPVLLYSPRPWMKSLLQLCYKDLHVIPHAPNKHYKLSEAHIPSLRNFGVYFDCETSLFYKSIGEQIGQPSTIQKVYLSRVGNKTKRPIANEAKFIEAIEAKGFVPVQPEKLSLIDQIRLLRDAREIIVPGGSGLFNLVFAQRAERVIDIEPSSAWVHAHRSLLASLNLPYSIVYGFGQSKTEPHGAWNIDIDATLRLL